MRKQILICSLVGVVLVTIGTRYFQAVKSVTGNSQATTYQHGAVIIGTVLSLEGQAIAGADVFAVSARGSRGMRPHTTTDSKGNFTIAELKPGTYYIGAEKESEGYASNRDSFASAGLAEVPQIVLVENQVVSGVILRFGPRSAKLTGQVINAKTKKPIEVADIVLRRADNPKHFYSIGLNDPKVNNRFKVLVPPLPFTIEVTSVGYENWTYSRNGSGKHKNALQLVSGQRKDLTILLQPK
jgi:hypothetical protein